MQTKLISYKRHRFPSEIISHAVWLYHRFCLSFREVEELLAERGIIVTYESVRQWCLKLGPADSRRLKKQQRRLGNAWHVDEGVNPIQGVHQYLWRAVDQDCDKPIAQRIKRIVFHLIHYRETQLHFVRLHAGQPIQRIIAIGLCRDCGTA
jgi:transposase-like protein